MEYFVSFKTLTTLAFIYNNGDRKIQISWSLHYETYLRVLVERLATFYKYITFFEDLGSIA